MPAARSSRSTRTSTRSSATTSRTSTRPSITTETIDDQDVRIIRSVRRRRTIAARRRNGTIEILIPNNLSPTAERDAISRIYQRLQRAQGGRLASDEDLAARAHALNHSVLNNRAEFSSIRWSNVQQRRWGSYSPLDGSIRISARLKHVPAYVLDSVIVHELVHSFIPDGHTPEFWTWADRAPQGERAKGYLEAYSQWGSAPS